METVTEATVVSPFDFKMLFPIYLSELANSTPIFFSNFLNICIQSRSLGQPKFSWRKCKFKLIVQKPKSSRNIYIY